MNRLTFLKSNAGHVLAILAMLPMMAFAQEPRDTVGGERYNRLDDAAMAQTKKWQNGGRANSIKSSDGKIVFAFGQSMPVIICSPGRSCDIELAPGEKVKSVALSDKENWSWSPAESVDRGKTVQHVIVQPRANNVAANGAIYTNQRTYHFRLVSEKTAGNYMHSVGFYYPGELVTAWEDKAQVQHSLEALERKDEVMDKPVDLDRLAFDYEINGNAPFKPVRVFNNGEQVFIEMPPLASHDDNPVLVLIDDQGKANTVNYRVKINQSSGVIHYVVDKLFANAEMVLDGKTVRISWLRKKTKKNWWGN